MDMKALGQPALQQQTLHFFGELVAIRPDWAGKLILGVGEGCSASGFPAACSLAGAASLLIEPSLTHAKAVLRDGGIDFLVNTVDEALRTLKNEIRKGRPLAVALVSDADGAVAELLDRGVQPDLLFSVAASQALQSGATWREVPKVRARTDEQQTTALQSYLSQRAFVAYLWPLPGRAAVRAFDADLLAILPENDAVRRGWGRGIAR